MSPSSATPRPGRSLAVLALTLAAFFAASSAPTPLYRLYQQDWGFSSGMLTLVFAVYAFSLLLAMLTMGALSDYLGRRPVLLGALALEVLSMAVFATAHDVQSLLWARVLQGVATGVAGAALGAALLDVDRDHGALINTLAPMLGMAAGVMGANELVALLPGLGRTLVFWLLLVLFALAACAVLCMPESGQRRPGAWAALRPRVRLPQQARAAFVRMAPMDMAVWALGGFYLSLAPTLLRVVTGSEMAAGLAVCINTVSAAVGIWCLRAWPARGLLRLGGVALLAGVALLLVGVREHSLVLMLSASVVAGVGFGVGFQGALRSVMPLAAAHERAGLLSAVYILSYLAFSLPAIAAGLMTQHMGLEATTYVYGGMLMLLAALALLGTRQRAVAV